jgi:zinc protease
MISSSNYGLPFDHAESSADRIADVRLEDIHTAARDILDSEKLTWVVVGDLEEIEDEVRELNYGEVEVWDAYGNLLR